MAVLISTWWPPTPDSISACAACTAILLSIILLVKQIKDERRLKHLESLQANGQMLVEAWKQLIDAPDAVRFHGFSKEDLEAAGITIADLVYLLVCFQASDYHYQHKDRKTGPFPATSLRYAILANPQSRKAWPFMKPFFVASTRYVRRIEETIRQLDLVQNT